MKKIFLTVLMMLFLAGTAYGAATVTEGGRTVQLTAIDADFSYSVSCMMYGKYGSGVRVAYIELIPGATNDVFSIKEGSASGPEIVYCVAADSTDQKIIYLYGAKIRPVVDYSACSLSTGASVIFQLWPQQ